MGTLTWRRTSDGAIGLTSPTGFLLATAWRTKVDGGYHFRVGRYHACRETFEAAQEAAERRAMAVAIDLAHMEIDGTTVELAPGSGLWIEGRKALWLAKPGGHHLYGPGTVRLASVADTAGGNAYRVGGYQGGLGYKGVAPTLEQAKAAAAALAKKAVLADFTEPHIVDATVHA